MRKLTVTCNHLVKENDARVRFEQMNLFDDPAVLQNAFDEKTAELEREKNMQKAMLKLKDKYGKNAVIKGTDLQEGATTVERNGQIGGHRA